MDASDAAEDKKHGLEDREEQPPKHYKHSEELQREHPNDKNYMPQLGQEHQHGGRERRHVCGRPD